MTATALTRDGPFEATPVGLRRRIGAAAVDWTICVVAYLIVAIPMGALEGLGFALRSESSTSTLGLVVIVLAEIGVFLPIVVYFTLGLREGHTLGMAAFDFKTLDARGGKPPGTLRSAWRALLSVVFAVAVYFAYMGHSAERRDLSRHLLLVYVVSLTIAGVALLDKAFVPAHRSGRALTDRLFGLVRVTGAPDDDDRGLSDWLNERARTEG